MFSLSENSSTDASRSPFVRRPYRNDGHKFREPLSFDRYLHMYQAAFSSVLSTNLISLNPIRSEFALSLRHETGVSRSCTNIWKCGSPR